MDGYRENRPQECGETGFPHPSADAGRRPAHPGPAPWEGLGGRSPPKNNRMFIAALCGAAAWTANVNLGCSPTRMRR